MSMSIIREKTTVWTGMTGFVLHSGPWGKPKIYYSVFYIQVDFICIALLIIDIIATELYRKI